MQIIQKPQRRGVEIFTAQLCLHLEENNHKTILLSLVKDKGGLPFKGDIFSINANLKKKFIDLFAWHRLAKNILVLQPDIVQANAADTLKYAVLSKMIFRWRQPLVYRNASIMSAYIGNGFSRFLNGFFLKQVDKIVSVSEKAKNDIATIFNIHPDRIVVIPVGIEKAAYSKLTFFDVPGPHLVHVGGFSFEKNHLGLLRIFSEVLKSFPTSKLWLVGDGALKEKIQQEVKNKGLESSVHFVGNVNNAMDYIHSADVLLLPSIIEGLPAVILESFICKTPVVAFEVGGVPEVLTNVTGWPVPSNNEDAFVKSILEVLHSGKEELNIKKEAAFKLVNENYQNTEISLRFEELYRDLCIEKGWMNSNKSIA